MATALLFAREGARVAVTERDEPRLDRVRARTCTPEEIGAAKAQVASRIRLGRRGAAEDIAEAALFLADDASRYVLGAELVIDGGFLSCEPVRRAPRSTSLRESARRW